MAVVFQQSQIGSKELYLSENAYTKPQGYESNIAESIVRSALRPLIEKWVFKFMTFWNL